MQGLVIFLILLLSSRHGIAAGPKQLASPEALRIIAEEEEKMRLRKIDYVPPVDFDPPRFQNPSKKYRAYIPKGTALYELNLEPHSALPKEIIAWVKEITKGGVLSFVYDRKGNPRYIVLTKDADRLSEELDLRSKLDASKKYKRNFKHFWENTHLEIEQTISFHIENIKAEYFDDIFESEQSGARANRFAYKAFSPWSFPVEFGLGTSFQDGRYDRPGNDSQLTWNALYFGPRLRFLAIDHSIVKVSVEGGLEQSLFFKVEDAFQLSTNLWFVMAEGEFKLYGKKVLLGLGYRQMKGHIKKTSSSKIPVFSDRRNINSIDFSLGYRFSQFW